MVRSMVRPLIRPLISGGGGAREIYNLNGIDEHITIPTVALVGGDSFSFKFIGIQVDSGSYRGFLNPASGTTLKVRLQSDNTLLVGGVDLGAILLDGVAVPNGHAMPTDGLEHTLALTLIFSSSIMFVGSGTAGANPYNSAIYDLSITAASGNRFYPINDGWANNPVIADTISNQDGTSTNFTEERWVEK